MKILGIETSCDDTSVALVEGHDEQISVISEATASQIDLHAIYGGVVPEVAARAHTEAMIPLLETIYDNNNPPDAIAVTAGPGLITSLIVGTQTAATLAQLTGIPLIAVNHIEGHIYANWIDAHDIEFPALALIVSGGHTELIFMAQHLTYQKIGWTVDDAAGEAFDKIGKIMGLEYPGGPKISKLAENGNPDAVALPRPMIDSGNLNFSFSGLKTAAKLYLEQHPAAGDPTNSETECADFCASFEQAIVDVLVAKTLAGIAQHKPKTVLLGGGVAANQRLREQIEFAIEARNEMLISMAEDQDIKPNGIVTFVAPQRAYTTDNAAMIAAAAHFKASQKEFTEPDALIANPSWELPTA